jgi:hypothetical protein
MLPAESPVEPLVVTPALDFAPPAMLPPIEPFIELPCVALPAGEPGAAAEDVPLAEAPPEALCAKAAPPKANMAARLVENINLRMEIS